MANISATPVWTADVYQWADGDVLDGGPDSLEVLPVKQLANRSLFQRLHNVTPWSDTLAAAHGYPAGAVVLHNGSSWRAKVDNSVQPGTDANKWERWGYSESELNTRLAQLLPYGVPLACGNTGPDGLANKTRIYKSAVGEYWMWLGDAWRVVAGKFLTAQQAVATVAAGGSVNVHNFALHRAGNFTISAAANLTTVATNHQLFLTVSINSVSSARDTGFGPAANWLVAASASHTLSLQQGDVVSTSVSTSHACDINWGVGMSYTD